MTTKISYPQPHDGTGQLYLFGDKSSSKIVFLCAGYPDDQSAFTPLAKRLAEESNCFVGVACLPGFEKAEDRSYAELPPDGFTLAEWASCLREATKALRASSANKDAKLTTIYHDWGVIAGLQFTNQAIEEESKDLAPSQVVLFDILTKSHPKTPNQPNPKDPRSAFKKFLDGIRMLSYQSCLALSFYIQKFLPAFLVVLYLRVIYLAFDLLRIFPSGPGDVEYIYKEWLTPTETARVGYKAYPYKVVLGAIFTGNVKMLKGFTLPMDLKKTPVLFLYGAGKRFDLHPVEVLALLQQEEKEGNRSKVVRVENAGHWLYLTEPDICFQEVQKFLA